MTTMKRTAACMLVASLLAGAAAAAELGDKAAPLKIKEWIKGEPVDVTKADADKVFLVEFWATWCPPCRASIPHLTELQSKYKDKGLVIIGVSDEDAATVKPFVEKMGAKMEYTIAVDDDHGTSKGYMRAYGQDGIPHSFVVKQGRVVWHQNPLEEGLDAVIEKALAGEFGPEQIKTLQKEQKERQERLDKAFQIGGRYFETLDLTGAENKTKRRELGEKFLEFAKDEPMLLNQWAWILMESHAGNEQRDMDLVVKAGKLACEATDWNDANVLDTYARSLFETGERDEAIKWQKKAVELAKVDEQKEQLQKTLKRYEEAGKSEGPASSNEAVKPAE